MSSVAAAESRKIIAVVDTGINSSAKLDPFLCDLPKLNFTSDQTASDLVGHGTRVAKAIAKNINPRKYCIASFKVFNSQAAAAVEFGTFFDKVNELRPAIINLSYSGNYYSSIERRQLATALMINHSKVVVAAGNNGIELRGGDSCETYPACYKFNSNFYVIGDFYQYANYGSKITNRINSGGEGTSLSAAIFTGMLAAGLVE